MRREQYQRILAPIRAGDFVLCVNREDCKWAIYRAIDPGSDWMSQDRGILFTNEPYDLREDLAPLRHYGCHYREVSNRYQFNNDCIHASSIAAVYHSEEDMLQVAQQLREAEEAYVAATQTHRDRFAVLATLLREVA